MATGQNAPPVPGACESYPPELDALAQQVQDHDRQLHGLRRLQTDMSNSQQMFFEHEQRSVTDALRACNAKRTELARELQERVTIFEQELSTLQETIATRQRILEVADSKNGVLSGDHGSYVLLNMFAKGQASLSQELKGLKKRVEQAP